jgi:hypothetical protein
MTEAGKAATWVLIDEVGIKALEKRTREDEAVE